MATWPPNFTITDGDPKSPASRANITNKATVHSASRKSAAQVAKEEIGQYRRYREWIANRADPEQNPSNIRRLGAEDDV